MKLTVSPDGWAEIETDDAVQAAALIAALRNGVAAKPVKKQAKKRSAPKPGVALSKQLLTTWQWLVANDTADGVPIGDIAAGLRIPTATAQYRIRRLIDHRLASKAGHARYRAGEES